MHSKDLRARSETEQRIYMVSAWRDAPHLYSDRERAALAWAEAVTRLVDQQVPDAVYDQAHNSHSHNRSVRNRTNRAAMESFGLQSAHVADTQECAASEWPVSGGSIGVGASVKLRQSLPPWPAAEWRCGKRYRDRSAAWP